MRLSAKPRVAGAFMVLGLILGVPSTRGVTVPPSRVGIVITSTKVQPVQDPYYEVFFNLAILPNTVVNAGDNVDIASIPYIGNGGSNLVKEPAPSPSGAFLNLFDNSSSPFYNSFVFETNTSDMSLEILYTGVYKGVDQSITAGATGLDVPLYTVGVETIDFPNGVPYNELVAPLTYTSNTSGGIVNFTSTVVPTVVPEPATAVAFLSGLPLVLLALRRAKARAA